MKETSQPKSGISTMLSNQNLIVFELDDSGTVLTADKPERCIGGKAPIGVNLFDVLHDGYEKKVKQTMRLAKLNPGQRVQIQYVFTLHGETRFKYGTVEWDGNKFIFRVARRLSDGQKGVI